MQKRAVAILTGPDTYLDHLGVICYLMEIPLLITEEDTYQAALTFYPFIQVIKKEIGELSYDFLATNFDVIFESGRFWVTELESVLSHVYKKNMRFVYCPHGNSDKGHSFLIHMNQDISLFYGQHMLDLLTKTGAKTNIRALVRTGNCRLQLYKKHKEFYQSLARTRIQSKLIQGRPTVLYAPTWQDGENPSSFFSQTGRVIKDLQEEYNVLIKMHPFLEEQHPAHTYQILGLYEQVEGVCFIQKYPAIYSLLEICDLYIGDYSSIGYDFLYFDRPLYFFAEEGNASCNTLIHTKGLVIPSGVKINQFIQETIEENKKKNRKELYEHAFGEEKDFLELRRELELTIF